MPATADNLTNEQRSALELAAFKADTPGPYFAYHAGAAYRPSPSMGGAGMGRRITTWMGDELAAVVDARPVYRSNLGDRRQNFRARGVNGATYSGTAYLDAGDYVRMRPVKR